MHSKHPVLLLLLFGIICMMFGIVGPAAGSDVPYHTAHQVAQQKLQHHLTLYGAWNGHTAPYIGDGQAVHYKERLVAYNFAIEPSGHILVAVDRAFSPIPLYSERGRFDPSRADQPATLESWIVPELYNRVGALNAHRRDTRSLPSTLRRTVSAEGTRVQRAWDYFTGTVAAPTVDTTRSAAMDQPEVSTVTVGPLMETAWNQGYPYNTLAPEMDDCDHALTGCVATAWAQAMYYYRWPDAATGSHWYPWNGTIVSAVFEGVSYDWDAMPVIFNDYDSYDEIAHPPEAVSMLMRHAGVAAEMNYGCDESGSDFFANDVLDTYFNYKAMERHDRSAQTDAVEWFELIRSELDGKRIVIFSIFGVNGGGHEVVVDGYKLETVSAEEPEVLTRTVHINLGWGGYADAYYDISNDFATPEGFEAEWTASSQVAVTGIAPNQDPRPVVTAGTDKRQVRTGDTVTLSGSTTLQQVPEPHYQWLQVSIGDTGSRDVPPVVVLSDYDTLNATFRAPEVDATTDLVFMLKVTDTNRSVGFDKVTVTVLPNRSSPSSGGSGSSGPCFISTLQRPRR
ncbi:C10 family peptidase [Desulfatitalea alkaliphila]|uniref:C10 family peptidase n=1 Tax=Desulfatitalea alkaliphila TaxID=2929485 RepID=A0AA41R5P4_9BACT|nr:C10 family peptidase [Desulfatitalea alkaliphila]MCJ8501918.1 C10 family peptidase [Desulfatitalea alkaliphila]